MGNKIKLYIFGGVFLLDKLILFEKDSAFNLMQKAFLIGIFPLLFPAFWLGKHFAILFSVERQVPADTPGYFTFRSEPNVILGILIGASILIISILIWKIICQALLIVLEAFEIYTSNHNDE